MENHLAAVVIPLRATQSYTVRNHLGLAVQRLFKNCMSHLEEPVHFSQAEFQPYTVSGLMEPFDAKRPTRVLLGRVKPGDKAWIRFTALNSVTVAAVNMLMADFPDKLAIDHQTWEIPEAPIWDTRLHPWAGHTSYEKLWNKAVLSGPPHKLRFEFATPTTFKSGGNWLPLPYPPAIFNSLLQRWFMFSPRPLPEEMKIFLESMLPLSRFDAFAEHVVGKQGKQIAGFVGDATFVLRDDDEAMESFQAATGRPVRMLRYRLACFAQMLAEFGVFSGVGSKTAMGMGMTRCF